MCLKNLEQDLPHSKHSTQVTVITTATLIFSFLLNTYYVPSTGKHVSSFILTASRDRVYIISTLHLRKLQIKEMGKTFLRSQPQGTWIQHLFFFFQPYILHYMMINPVCRYFTSGTPTSLCGITMPSKFINTSLIVLLCGFHLYSL